MEQKRTPYDSQSQVNTWVYHFKTLLNSNIDNNPEAFEQEQQLEQQIREQIKVGNPIVDEVMEAINQLKNNKSSGIDGYSSRTLESKYTTANRKTSYTDNNDKKI